MSKCKRCGGPDDHNHDLTDCCARLMVRAREMKAERDWLAGYVLRIKFDLPPSPARNEALRRASAYLEPEPADNDPSQMLKDGGAEDEA